MTDSFLVIDYVYLDSEERKRFAQASHEYLIEQLQFTGAESLTSVTNKYRLNFNHPCKYLIWAPHYDLFQKPQKWLSYAVDGDWNSCLDTFAKALTVVTAAGLAVASNGVVSAEYEQTSGPDAGSLVPLTVADGVNATLTALLAKVEVQWNIQSANGTTALGSIATLSDIDALFGNCIVTRNSLTVADITILASTILAGLTTATEATKFVNAVSYVAVDPFNYANNIDGSENPVYDAKLQLNGHDRFQSRDGNYFNYVQPYQHFTHTPADGINVYSFALKAEDHQPTGSCNFSRIDNATLNVSVGYNNTSVNSSTYTSKYLQGSSSVMNIYTVNYNVLRVMSGMAGTAYSN